MEEKKYAYMVNYGEDRNIGIMYHLGKFLVVRFVKKDNGNMMTYTLRQYKTLRGAENYLLKDFSYADRLAPNIKYETEAFIKKGEYWK